MTPRNRAHRLAGLLVLWLLLPMLTVDRGHAQERDLTGATQPADSISAMTPPMDESVPSDGPMQGLPQRAPQPRTLHDFWPAFAALAVLWVGMVAFVAGFGGSLRRITERMQSAERGGTRG